MNLRLPEAGYVILSHIFICLEDLRFFIQNPQVFALGSAWFVYLKAGYAPRTMDHFNPVSFHRDTPYAIISSIN